MASCRAGEHGFPPTRTGCVRRSVVAASVAAPWIVPSSVFGATAPSNRIQVGCIGVGNQGIGILRRFLNNDDVQLVAVCDVNKASYGYKTEEQYLGRDPACKEVNAYYREKAGAAVSGVAGIAETRIAHLAQTCDESLHR